MQSASAWRKSSRSSGTNNSNCVEARSTVGAFQVRDSKLGQVSPVFNLPAADFAGLLDAARRG